MRQPPFAYPRAETEARVIARVEAGYSLAVLCGLEGYPSRQTLRRWAREDPRFALRLERACAQGAVERRGWALARGAFDEGRAEAFLAKVRQGHAVRDLVRRAEGPNRDLLNDWKRRRPDFATALEAAVRFSREVRRPRRAPYDEAVADALVLRVSLGEALRDIVGRDITGEAGAPGRATVARWRREQPLFDQALKTAARSGLRRKMRLRRRSTPALTAKIVAHIRAGGSLRSAARRVAGAPHGVTLYGWMRTRPEFAAAVAAARAQRDDTLADAVLDAAEAATPETAEAAMARMAMLRRRAGQVRGGRKPSGA